MNAVKEPDEVKGALSGYASGLGTKRDHATVEAERAKKMLAELNALVPGTTEKVKIKTKDEFKAYAELLKEMKGKVKFLDQERLLSVGPLNVQVKEINDWFRPALDGGKAVIDALERMMSRFLVEEKDRERALLKKAEEESKKALELAAAEATQSFAAAAPSVEPGAAKAMMKEAASTMESAAAAMPEKVEGVSHKQAWTYEIVDESLLERRFLMPNPAAIKAWIKENGDQNVPAGVKVTPDVKFTVRS